MADADIGKHTAGKPLHGQIADIGCLRFLRQSQVALGRDVAERELNGLKVPGGNAVFRNIHPVRSHADVSDPSALLRFQCAGEGAVRVFNIRNLFYLVELEEVDIIGLQHAQAVLDVLQHTLFVLCGTLRGDDHIAPHVVQCNAEFFFTVRVSVGRVKVADAAIVSGTDQLNGISLVAALQRQAAKRGLRGNEAAFSENNSFHGRELLSETQGAEHVQGQDRNLKSGLYFAGIICYNAICSQNYTKSRE